MGARHTKDRNEACVSVVSSSVHSSSSPSQSRQATAASCNRAQQWIRSARARCATGRVPGLRWCARLCFKNNKSPLCEDTLRLSRRVFRQAVCCCSALTLSPVADRVSAGQSALAAHAMAFLRVGEGENAFSLQDGGQDRPRVRGSREKPKGGGGSLSWLSSTGGQGCSHPAGRVVHSVLGPVTAMGGCQGRRNKETTL